MHRFMFIILCVVLLAACGAPETSVAPTIVATSAPISNTDDPCAPQALKEYRVQYNRVIDRWGDAILVAGQSKATDLHEPINSLQQIADELNNIAPPPCAEQAHADSIAAMQMSIGGYQDLLAKKDVGSTLRIAIDKLAQARTKIAALPGTPVPAPTLLPSSTPLPTWTPEPTAAGKIIGVLFNLSLSSSPIYGVLFCGVTTHSLYYDIIQVAIRAICESSNLVSL